MLIFLEESVPTSFQERRRKAFETCGKSTTNLMSLSHLAPLSQATSNFHIACILKATPESFLPKHGLPSVQVHRALPTFGSCG